MSDHGGDIYAASRRTGIPAEKIIDFSASINPLGVPQEAALVMKREIERLFHYPEPYAEGLAASIAGRLEVDPGCVICGNGSTELIYLLPRALRPERVLVAQPTFCEYEKASRQAGAYAVAGVPLLPKDSFDLIPETFIRAMQEGRSAMAFLCNPNNPTGRLVEKRDVLAIADAARRLSCLLVVDEAFIDFCPADSVAREAADNPCLVVLRSMTKFYALSGLRLGYAVAHPSVAARIRSRKEPWTVNSLACHAGIAVLGDGAYEAASHRLMEREKSFLEGELTKMAIPFVPSRANYYLLRVKDGGAVVEGLEKRGILVRGCANFAGLDESYIRVAVRSRAENERLIEEMGCLCAHS